MFVEQLLLVEPQIWAMEFRKKEEQSTISCLHRQHICSIKRQISQPVNQTNLNLEEIGHENNIEQ